MRTEDQGLPITPRREDFERSLELIGIQVGSPREAALVALARATNTMDRVRKTLIFFGQEYRSRSSRKLTLLLFIERTHRTDCMLIAGPWKT